MRFIPTRVGNTYVLSGLYLFYAVHPHACGEYASRKENSMDNFGSSPRVWGIPGLYLFRTCSMRFIPTRVGNTYEGTGQYAPHTVHPHACGEYGHK